MRLAPGHKTGVKNAASRLALCVAMELLTAAPAASTHRAILPPVLFPCADLYINIYNAFDNI